MLPIASLEVESSVEQAGCQAARGWRGHSPAGGACFLVLL